jgi:hypothetical protein
MKGLFNKLKAALKLILPKRQTVISYNNYQLSGCVNKAGLKKFARDIQPVLAVENKRAGKR